jgi:hypothetical protein
MPGRAILAGTGGDGGDEKLPARGRDQGRADGNGAYDGIGDAVARPTAGERSAK